MRSLGFIFDQHALGSLLNARVTEVRSALSTSADDRVNVLLPDVERIIDRQGRRFRSGNYPGAAPGSLAALRAGNIHEKDSLTS